MLSTADLTFSPGDTTETIFITTVHDPLIESDEVFLITLSTGSSNVQIDDGTTTVTIVDDDSKYTCIHLLLFNKAKYSFICAERRSNKIIVHSVTSH